MARTQKVLRAHHASTNATRNQTREQKLMDGWDAAAGHSHIGAYGYNRANSDASDMPNPVTELPVGLPTLPTPDGFAFPYVQPYSIQLDLMRTVFRAIEDGKIAIVESPTGTGKSLTLLTSTLTWLAQNQRRLEHQATEGLREQLKAEDPDEPAWVIDHTLKSRLAGLKAGQEERSARLAVARERERKLRLADSVGAFRNGQVKRSKISGSEQANKEEDMDEDRFLPEDKLRPPPAGERDDDGMFLSKEVRELMQKFESAKPKLIEAEKEEDVPKIYYTSRTHTQLRQLTAELLKTSFPAGKVNAASNPDELDTVGEVSLVPLASRKQLCINDKVRALGKSGGDERINEACLEMQKSGNRRCEFLPKKEEETAMLDARDEVLASVKDIEDIVALGRKSCVCPYYSTRRAVKQAQIVTMPYNLLLQKNAREALDIDLTGQVVVIDEAHNLIDTLLSIHSTTLSSSQLSSALSQLQQYHQRFRNRLKPLHAVWIKQTLSVLSGLLTVCNSALNEANGPGRRKNKHEMLDVNSIMERLGGGADQVNLLELVLYLKESKLARKVSGFAEKVEEQRVMKESKTARTQSARHASIASFHIVESFLLSLTDARDDSRILLSTDDAPEGPKVDLKYILLNPAERFREVVESARSVVLAGGTMEPISDFLTQLFPGVPKDRFSTLSCKHVIPKDHLLTQVVSLGPSRTEFEFKFANRDDQTLLGELGAVVQSTIGLVPDGVVVFLPSYAFLDKVKQGWNQSGLLAKLGEKKTLFYEPQTSGDVESTLRDYALSISSAAASRSAGSTSSPHGAAPSEKRKTGALLFAVVGGKLSEGINFSDSLGRCVIMVGLPFANVGSVELQERMKYVEKLPGAGKDAARELYENLCMRAVNQSIGRAIRHASDYATILLVDKRYATPRIRNKLPKWIGEDIKVPTDWSGAARSIAAFFREKRERGL